jgi:uncharacterized protein YndB with AHSA1/START domain
VNYEARVERVLNATLEEVFDAYTSVEAQRVWYAMGEQGQPDLIVEIHGDPVAGGEWEAAWGHSKDEMFRERGVYQVVDPPHRVVLVSTFYPPGGAPGTEAETEVTFEALGDKTRMVVVQRRLPSEELRDFVVTVAWPGAFERIERYLRAKAGG